MRGGGSGGNDPFEDYDLPDTLDDHEMMGEEELEKIVDQLNEIVSDRDKESLKDLIDKHCESDKEDKAGRQAGTGTGGWTFISNFRVEKKKKWETVIRKWANRYIKHDYKEAEQWAREHRRISEFKRSLGEDIFLPSEVDMEDFLEDTYRITVFFFLDTSGSCWDLKDRFFEAASSLPEDKFDVRLFCFDTAVKETTLASKKVYGGGGTDFKIIEDHIQQVIKAEKLDYPKAVFLITDGYGSQVAPERPANWYWFLSHDYRQYITKESNTYMLKDYE
jgi:predicted metal-dependent peptidase